MSIIVSVAKTEDIKKLSGKDAPGGLYKKSSTLTLVQKRKVALDAATKAYELALQKQKAQAMSLRNCKKERLLLVVQAGFMAAQSPQQEGGNHVRA